MPLSIIGEFLAPPTRRSTSVASSRREIIARAPPFEKIAIYMSLDLSLICLGLMYPALAQSSKAKQQLKLYKTLLTKQTIAAKAVISLCIAEYSVYTLDRKDSNND